MSSAQSCSHRVPKTSFKANLTQAVLRTTSTLDLGDLQKIIIEMQQSERRGHPSVEKLSQINKTLDNLTKSGKISPQKSLAIKNQIGTAVEKAVANNTLHADKRSVQWFKFGGKQKNDSIRAMAQNAARTAEIYSHSYFRRKNPNQQVSKTEVNLMLKKAAKDGTITLNEINSMYKGIHDAFRDGQISAQSRDKAIQELDRELTEQAGTRKGHCRRRQGHFANKLGPEAEKFVNKTLGAEPYQKGKCGFTRFNFREPQKLQDQVKMITKDNHVSRAERGALVNQVLRDGHATQNELQAIQLAMLCAVREGHITRKDYNRTIKHFQIEIARMTGGRQKLGDIKQMMQVQHTGQCRFVA
ncbi:MAG: hypothetical protein QGI45_00935 [Myxococcota bacterium]|jgi:hypothetical protein|nr:hypothetical protein [Myxococcota bacterium]